MLIYLEDLTGEVEAKEMVLTKWMTLRGEWPKCLQEWDRDRVRAKKYIEDQVALHLYIKQASEGASQGNKIEE